MSDNQPKANILTNVEERRKFRSRLGELTTILRTIDDYRESLKEGIAAISADYGIEKKHIRRLAATVHKANFSEQRKHNEAFEMFYEAIFGGVVPADGDQDPLDGEDDEE